MGWKVALLASILGCFVHAQELSYGERNGLVQTVAALYPAKMLNHDALNNYVGGNLSVRFDEKYAFRGDIYVFTSTQSGTSVITDHTLIQSSFLRFFPVKKWDPFVGVGLGLSGIQTVSNSLRRYQPTVSLNAGLQFHVFDYFYFFVESSYQHMQDPFRTQPLDQLFASGGLGLQLPVKKLRGNH
jgi:hypothetical protein